MRLEIRHRLAWEYDAPIMLEPLTVRLRPRVDALQTLLEYDLSVEPLPAGRSEILDSSGNSATLLWFSETHERLALTSRALVENRRTNPYDFLLTPAEALALPFEYPPWERRFLAPYLERTAGCAEVDELARSTASQAGWRTVDSITALTAHLSRELPARHRATGDPWAPAQTLTQRGGACRDLAVLFVDALRSLGLAARFVSGYAVDAPIFGVRQLHAWVEVYLPGAGWRGWDPTLGLATADRHVPVAAAAEPAGAAPTRGTYRGSARSQMSFEISVESG